MPDAKKQCAFILRIDPTDDDTAMQKRVSDLNDFLKKTSITQIENLSLQTTGRYCVLFIGEQAG